MGNSINIELTVPFSIWTFKNNDGLWHASAHPLPFIKAMGRTQEEAIQNLRQSLSDYLRDHHQIWASPFESKENKTGES